MKKNIFRESTALICKLADFRSSVWEIYRDFATMFRNVDVYLYGGCLRDLDNNKIPNDIDVVVRCTPEEWREICFCYRDESIYKGDKNSFTGAIRFQMSNGYMVDIWPMSNYGADAKVIDVLNCTNFSCNQIIQNIKSFLDAGLFSSIKSVDYINGQKSKTVTITNPDWNFRPEKLKRIAKKLGYSIHE